MRNLTFANQLTILRIVLIPAFVLLVVDGRLGTALLVFMTAGATDALDGLIARRAGQRTSLGAWLDPMADKLLLVTTFIVLTVAVINLAVGRREFRPSIYGKIATATYIITCVLMMYFNYLQRTSVVVTVAIYASAAITLISGFHYVFTVTKTINQN